tara:strand:- start:76 stop:273 length:198 start_codon:yes stop_codon:yes gene_type:complete
MNLDENLTQIIIAIIGLFAVGLVIKVAIKKTRKSNRVKQKNIHIGGNGDVVGRDKINNDNKNGRK